jgi:hypothetical protein
MKFFVRSPLVSVAALTIYLAVQVVAAAHHHHHGAPSDESSSATFCDTSLPVCTALPADIDNDDEGACLLCSVLHLPQTLPALCQLEAATVVCSRELSPAAVIRSHPTPTATHSRAPPNA